MQGRSVREKHDAQMQWRSQEFLMGFGNIKCCYFCENSHYCQRIHYITTTPRFIYKNIYLCLLKYISLVLI